MWKTASKAFGEAILDALRAWGGCISQGYRVIYQWGITGDIGPFGRGTYVHLGRKAASTLAPEGPRSFPLRSAETMEISMVAGWLVAPKVSLVSVLHVSDHHGK